MNQNGRRRMVWAGAGLLLLALLVWAIWPRPESVDLAPVTQSSFVVTLDEEGETRVKERFVVSAPVSGRLLRIEHEPGDPVVAGETVLAVLQPQEATLLDPRGRAEAEARVRALEAELERAKHERERSSAELEFAKLECGRARRLAAQDVLSVERLDEAELKEKRSLEALDAAEQAVEAASHSLASARARLLDIGNPERRGDDPLLLHAPVDGVLLRRMHVSEAVVSAGEPLVEVGDARELEVVADYLSTDAVKIRPGARVFIERWGGPGTLVGRVRRVEPSGFTKVSALGVEEKRVNVVVELVTPHQERVALSDGFRVEARVVVSECDDVIAAPSSSLFRHGEGWAAFAVVDGRAHLREVEVGDRTPALVEVVSGLELGDHVVEHPGDALADGVRVAPRTPPY